MCLMCFMCLIHVLHTCASCALYAHGRIVGLLGLVSLLFEVKSPSGSISGVSGSSIGLLLFLYLLYNFHICVPCWQLQMSDANFSAFESSNSLICLCTLWFSRLYCLVIIRFAISEDAFFLLLRRVFLRRMLSTISGGSERLPCRRL